MKQLFDVRDIYGNYYLTVPIQNFYMLENNPYYKDDFFGYINSEDKFISCKAHIDKKPQSVFPVSARKN